jgi:dolichol kinase
LTPREAVEDAGSAVRSAVENRKERIRHKIPASVVFELRRKGIHIVTAIVAVPLLLLLPLWWAVGIALASMVVIGATYVLSERGAQPQAPVASDVHEGVDRILEETRREDEGFPWASILYVGSLVVVAVASKLGGVPLAYAFAAYGILGMGDASSALIGVAYGRTPIPWNASKSVQGTAAGVTVGYLSGLLLALPYYVYHGLVFPAPLFGIVAAGAVAGMVAETLPRVEDNFAVPLAAFGAMVAVGWAAGLL